MKKIIVIINIYGPTDVDEASRAMMCAKDGGRTVYYAYTLSMLQLDMVSDIRDSGASHKGVLVRIEPLNDNPYVIEVNGKEESFPFIGTMTRE